MLGVRVGTRTLPELTAAAQESIVRRERSFVFACANPHSLVVANSDAEFRSALGSADAVVADGVGCQWGARLLGVSVGPRITGTDFFLSTMRMLDERGGRAFFFGSSEHVLEKLTLRARRDFPHLALGALSPPFRPWSEVENSAMVSRINAFAPDVLWVGMTAPKQEKWVAANVQALEAPVIGSIGAVFDYYAGVTQRAPGWVCRAGLEWLYRLPREPRRLWRRTLISAPQFVWLVLCERWSGPIRSGPAG
jgi:N-acetylglucosaminyldiphosphoundecaprenol N-acetyl-beta-D-mannosaminyltransferase